MKILDIEYKRCGQEKTRVTFNDDASCFKGICCKCCEKQGLQPIECKVAQSEFERFVAGKKLNKNDIKGMLLEMAVSDALGVLRIPHKHNPFNNTYPCYQREHPDITIPELNTVIEYKNLSENQVA